MRRLAVTFILVGCTWTPQGKYLDEGLALYNAKNYQGAVELFEKTVKVEPESEAALVAAREGARIALVDLKDYAKLTFFLNHLVLRSPSHEERVASQKLLAETYFDKLNDYKNAVIELNRALDFIRTGKESLNLRLMLARAHFFLNQYFQARSEIETALLDNPDQEITFRALLLKANVYFNEKKLDEALTLYQRLMVEYPEKSKTEAVALSLSVCYEEKEDFEKAISVLEKLKSDYKIPEMIELKIKRLKERQAQAPGAKGLRK